MDKIKIKYHTPIINWCDYQKRIMKNKPEIVWKGKVHETLVGGETISYFPYTVEDWALIHPKTIQKQEKQNEMYSNM